MSRVESWEQLKALDTTDDVIRAMYAEYQADECCDYRLLNSLIEHGWQLLPENRGGVLR